jgi:hypothetical protein
MSLEGISLSHINNLFIFPAEVPEKLLHASRAFSHLISIQQEKDCQIAQIGSRLMLLPANLRLSEYLGQRIGMMRYKDRIPIKRLDNTQEARSS